MAQTKYQATIKINGGDLYVSVNKSMFNDIMETGTKEERVDQDKTFTLSTDGDMTANVSFLAKVAKDLEIPVTRDMHKGILASIASKKLLHPLDATHTIVEEDITYINSMALSCIFKKPEHNEAEAMYDSFFEVERKKPAEENASDLSDDSDKKKVRAKKSLDVISNITSTDLLFDYLANEEKNRDKNGSIENDTKTAYLISVADRPNIYKFFLTGGKLGSSCLQTELECGQIIAACMVRGKEKHIQKTILDALDVNAVLDTVCKAYCECASRLASHSSHRSMFINIERKSSGAALVKTFYKACMKTW